MILFGCFRASGTSDPDMFVMNICKILEHYPEETVRTVTRPGGGLSVKYDDLPSAKQVRDACEEDVGYIYRAEKRRRDREHFEKVASPRQLTGPAYRETLDEKFAGLSTVPKSELVKGSAEEARVQLSVARRAKLVIGELRSKNNADAYRLATMIEAWTEEMLGKKLHEI